MRSKTFYEFLMTLRHPDHHDELAQFAKNAFFDLTFPKQATDYHVLTQYLELNANYLPTMEIFDAAWHLYLESQQEVF